MNHFAERALALNLYLLFLVDLDGRNLTLPPSLLIVPVVRAGLRASPLVRRDLPCSVGLSGPCGELLATDDAGLVFLGGHGCLAIIKSGISLALKARNEAKKIYFALFLFDSRSVALSSSSAIGSPPAAVTLAAASMSRGFSISICLAHQRRSFSV